MLPSLVNINQNSERCSLFWYVLLIVALFLTACDSEQSAPQQVTFSGPMMGTEYRVTIIKQPPFEDDRQQNDQIEKAILSAMNSVNQSMSNYIDGSELSRFNRLPANQWQKISPDFSRVISEAIDISSLSRGAFDVTLAKAIDAWGFGPNGEITQRPSAGDLALLRATVGVDKLEYKDHSLMKTVDGVEVSLSAIAKGYAVDKVALALEELGIENYLVNIGGELRASGKSADNQSWRVGIEKPHILGGIQEIAKLNNVAIATSGDYRNYLVVDGQQFSHTIDSSTLMPVFHKLALVSVISPRTSTADALATAMMAMDEKRAWQFAVDNDLAAYLIVRGDIEGEYIVQKTKKFEAYLQ
ncbi:MAG: thiamine biosynthesis lipoprotein [Arenicella sp.]|jgi:thiamine biosynthesis lipoprotein